MASEAAGGRFGEDDQAVGPCGLKSPCGQRTQGLLLRRLVRVRRILHIGKEANRLDDVSANWIHNLDEVVQLYDVHSQRLSDAKE